MRYILLSCLLAFTLGCTQEQVIKTFDPPPRLERKLVKYEIDNIAISNDNRYYIILADGYITHLMKGHCTILIDKKDTAQIESLVDLDTKEITNLHISGYHYLFLTEATLAKLNRYKD